MCDESSKRRIPFAFLEDIKQKFRATYGDRAYTAIAFSMNEEFAKILRKQMDFFNDPSADSFAQVNNKVSVARIFSPETIIILNIYLSSI